jgi:hypothetical protein
VKALLALIPIVGVILLGTVSFAANCTDPVPAPKYQVGDRFAWKYANGKERVWEVTGLEGNLTQVKWTDGNSSWASDNEGTYFFDQDWVIRKGVTKKGDALLSPKIGAFSLIGKKDLDFPLQMGKTWNFMSQNRSRLGLENFSSSLKVVGCEEVVTLAGKFLALKIETVEKASLSSGWGTIYRWYSPDAKNIVKAEFGMWTGGSYTAGIWGGTTRSTAYELMKLELR